MEPLDRRYDVNATELADRWWSLALRGCAGIAFGFIALLAPGVTLISLLFVFAVYAFTDGVLNLVYAFRTRSTGQPWGSMIVAGIVSILAGVVAAIWPGATGTALVIVAGAWAVVRGFFEIAAAVRLRKEIDDEWILGLTGVLSVIFGVLLLAYPGIGALALVTALGAYGLVFGVLTLAFAMKLRAWREIGPPQLPV